MSDLNEGSAVIVLVAEDETIVRLEANDILTEAGYRVLEARDGQEALTILEVHDDVRALFTDVIMPNVDGISLVKIVNDRWRHIGCVITSGTSDAPPDCFFVSKPYTPEAVLAALKASLAACGRSAT
jgi:CheY-like chemotaxis protein